MNEELENKEERQPVDIPYAKAISDEKKPTCRLVILAAVSLLLIIPLYAAVIIYSMKFEDSAILEKTFLCLVMYSLIGSPIIAVIAKIRIALSDGRLEGGQTSNTVIALGCFLLLLVGCNPFMVMTMRIAERVVCKANLKGLGTAIQVYVNDYDNVLPADNWCDRLIEEADVSSKSFVCPSSDSIEGESCYAMNKHAIGKKLSELPGEMVLLFETNLGQGDNDADREPVENRESFGDYPMVAEMLSCYGKVHLDQWNQIGGPEHLVNSHSHGVNVLLVNGDVEYIDFTSPKGSHNSLGSLCWDEAKTHYQISDYLAISEGYGRPELYLKSAVALAAIVCLLGFAIISSTPVWKYTSLALSIATGASVIGFLFGFLGEFFYYSDYLRGIGACGSAVVGFLAGLCYIGVLMKLQSRLNHEKSVRQLAITLGMAMGITCSTVLHFALILIHRDAIGWSLMMAGFPFGVVGGAILGLISGQVICTYYRKKVSVEIEIKG